MSILQQINESTAFLKEKGFESPEVGIILGTGLGKLIDKIFIDVDIPYEDIPHFPLATVDFHSGNLIYGTLNGKKIVAMHGRYHFYEGYSYQQITLPVRVMKKLGIKYLLISNASGAMNTDLKKGTLMLLVDHINLMPGNPLIGMNNDELGPRFPDMSQPYSSVLNEKLEKIANEHDIILHKGVYAALPGPMLETKAEYRYLRIIGADVVGMSTVPEVIVANHMGLPCAVISVITDECDPDNLAPLNLSDIFESAAKADVDLSRLISSLVIGL
ncbi:MAG: purine-nucleoside phosphorylase [Bacteroidales bacterium]|nr:purine-nucleoside phosphorylase [Bacteroidales bacterium]